MPFALSRSYLDSSPAPSRRAGKASGSKKGSGSKKAKAIKMVTSGAIIGGTSFVLGYVEGKYGMYIFSKAYKWLSADLVGALAVYALSAYGALPSNIDGYAVDAAHGALAYWAGFLGTEQGGGKVLTSNIDGLAKGTVKGETRQMTSGSPSMTAEQLWRTQQYR